LFPSVGFVLLGRVLIDHVWFVLTTAAQDWDLLLNPVQDPRLVLMVTLNEQDLCRSLKSFSSHVNNFS
jgi:hypothetical protein